MSDTACFLPYLRRGLAAAITSKDHAGTLPLGATVTARVTVNGKLATRAVRLRGPGQVIGIDPGEILRVEPAPGSAEVETNYFPYLELRTPDLPWAFTPAAPDDQGRLRPWLVLVVVEQQPGVGLGPKAGALLPVLTVGGEALPVIELPDLSVFEDWAALAHVQSAVPSAEIAEKLVTEPEHFRARILCPRRLRASRSYLACLVPAFEAGRQAGLGLPFADTVSGAWSNKTPSIDLPVFYSWTFSTASEVGDFEMLCKRLKPANERLELGIHPLDITDPGILELNADDATQPFTAPVVVDFVGAMKDIGVPEAEWDANHQLQFQETILTLLNAGADRRDSNPDDPEESDPVVSPPLHGAWQAQQFTVPDAGWLRAVNQDPVRRAAAGLGARVVRKHQEAFMAAAWDQAGQIREANADLNRSRLAVEISRSWATRIGALDDGNLVQATIRLQAFMLHGSSTVRKTLQESAVPTGLISSAFQRATRPGTPLARAWNSREVTTARLPGQCTSAFLGATSPNGVATCLAFAGPKLEVSTGTLSLSGRILTSPPNTVSRLAPGVIESGLDVSDVPVTVRGSLDPLSAVRAGVVARIPTLAGTIDRDGSLEPILPQGELVTRIRVGPVFEDALLWKLHEIDPEFLIPGVKDFPDNRVRLVEANQNFVGAFLIGANHEMSRELLWREFPADLGATFFRRFWDHSDPSKDDIVPLDQWDATRGIDWNMLNTCGATLDATILLIRGDLLRRYPDVHIFLVKGKWDTTQDKAVPVEAEALVFPQQDPVSGDWLVPVDEATALEPEFFGTLADGMNFYGFSLSSALVRGKGTESSPGWFVTFEEQALEPRFGMDLSPGAEGKAPVNWNDLAWQHMVATRSAFDGLHYASLGTVPAHWNGIDTHGPVAAPATWGRNGSHAARATFQRPFRMLIHAEKLVPG